ncbi:hypothetical protein C7U62_15465 [Mesorhizobium loti]|uniref:hypothetical protein n=1 Tax=Rhizobium meliloti TaxID=382 RepID=UPI0003624BB5|nr:hypothetical protein [Sinorhizobium meliloti]PST25003.1 hypothetical protein C7U62_15465 [Mesorhizobium loti]RVG14999.1 hypothetical protein CN234_03120 [Sinorhizobium meliloti]RVH60349.1 hypothetical protein CN213_05715 [Sinorhizobium meliloti]RVI26340.1 hypothetical protein CN207_18265 [Sinorhizobium meliloti]RVL94704.1 hypothetical protein CN136_21550 [Sinorhizobium meliloti]
MSDPKDGKPTEQHTPSRRTTVPPDMDFEPVPLPDRQGGSGTEEVDDPARSGKSKGRGKPTQGAGKNSPGDQT